MDERDRLFGLSLECSEFSFQLGSQGWGTSERVQFGASSPFHCCCQLDIVLIMPWKSKVNWRAVDWTKPDHYIAKKHEMSRERVRQVRQKLRKPKISRRESTKWSSHRWLDRLEVENMRKAAASAIAAEPWLDFFPCRNVLNYIGIGRSTQHFRSLVRGTGVPERDWRLSDMDLAAIWKLKSRRYANMLRNKTKLRSPKWHRTPLSHPHANNPEYRAAYMAEEAKAARWLDLKQRVLSAPRPPFPN